MSSQRKLDSARANAAKSTGPKSDQGKAAVAQNAVSHGLTAQNVIIYNEDEEEYQTELDHYLAHFGPYGKPECDLVRQLASVHWRICRYAAIESGLLEHQMDDDQQWIDDHYKTIADHHRLAIAFDNNCGANASLALLNRYEARLHREYHKTLRVLEEMQLMREARNAKLQNKANPISEQLSAPRLTAIDRVV
jgi:hypothetical protein